MNAVQLRCIVCGKLLGEGENGSRVTIVCRNSRCKAKQLFIVSDGSLTVELIKDGTNAITGTTDLGGEIKK